MRSENRGLPEQEEKLLWFSGKRRERIGVEHHARSTREAGIDQVLCRAPYSAARSNDNRIEPFVVEKFRKGAGVGKRLDHDRGQRGGVDGNSVHRARNAHESCTRAQCTPRGKPRSAGCMCRPAYNDAVTTIVFVRGAIGSRNPP